jgi:hypothetical protein
VLLGMEGGLSSYQHIKKSSVEESKHHPVPFIFCKAASLVGAYSAAKIGLDSSSRTVSYI